MGFIDEHESATAQNAARRNADYDAFVTPLDFSSGKFATKIVSPTPIQKPAPGLRHAGDVWRAKLFAKDVIEKYGAGEHHVTILGPHPTTNVESVLASFVISVEVN